MAIDPRMPEISFEAFLDWESAQPTKHEFAAGATFAMAGASRAHGTIALNLAALVRPAIRRTDCRAYVADMKVVPPGRQSVRYPDLVLTCDERDLGDDQVTRFPKLIVEVLSPATESVDRGIKFKEYRRIPTLLEYVLIDSAKVAVEVFRRANSVWSLREYGPGESFRLESIGLDLTVESLYEDISVGPVEREVIE